jgi:hypothetical protein
MNAPAPTVSEESKKTSSDRLQRWPIDVCVGDQTNYIQNEQLYLSL